MEQKRILWIIAAVGVFLLVVLGAALILYSPASQENRTLARASEGNTAADGWVSLSPDSEPDASGSGAPVVAADSNSGVFESGGEMGADNGAASLSLPADSDKTDVSGAGGTDELSAQLAIRSDEPEATSIDLTAYDDGRAAIVPNESEKKTVARAQEAAQKAAPAKTQTAVQPAKKPAASAPPRTETKPATVKATPKKAVAAAPAKTQYWVQVTSLSSKKSADAAREILEENKIAADVFTYENNKKQLFYRVRVGPYTTKSEAEYWRNKIAKIESFSASESYVTSTN